MTNQLKKDLPRGHVGEDIVMEYLKREGHKSVKRIIGNHKEYDILIDDGKISIEVKMDVMSKETGNIAVEHENYGKPSGIKTTTANYWAFIYWYKDEWYGGIFQTKALKKICKKAWSVNGGDDMASKIYLISVSKAHKLMDTWIIPKRLAKKIK